MRSQIIPRTTQSFSPPNSLQATSEPAFTKRSTKAPPDLLCIWNHQDKNIIIIQHYNHISFAQAPKNCTSSYHQINLPMISHLPIIGLPVTLQPSLQNPQMPPQRFTEHLKPKVSPPAAYGAGGFKARVGWLWFVEDILVGWFVGLQGYLDKRNVTTWYTNEPNTCNVMSEGM